MLRHFGGPVVANAVPGRERTTLGRTGPSSRRPPEAKNRRPSTHRPGQSVDRAAPWQSSPKPPRRRPARRRAAHVVFAIRFANCDRVGGQSAAQPRSPDQDFTGPLTWTVERRPRKLLRAGLLRIGTGEGKGDRAGLRRIARVAQVYLEHDGRHHRGLQDRPAETATTPEAPLAPGRRPRTPGRPPGSGPSSGFPWRSATPSSFSSDRTGRTGLP